MRRTVGFSGLWLRVMFFDWFIWQRSLQTTQKTNMEPKDGGLDDDIPLSFRSI